MKGCYSFRLRLVLPPRELQEQRQGVFASRNLNDSSKREEMYVVHVEFHEQIAA